MPVLLVAAGKVIVMLCAYAGIIASQKIYTRTDGLGLQIMVRCLKYFIEDVWFSHFLCKFALEANTLLKLVRGVPFSQNKIEACFKSNRDVLATVSKYYSKSCIFSHTTSHIDAEK